jgi:serine/threonine protein kinase
MIDSIIINYRITSLLGSGGMGSVYLAEHQTLGRKAAIKVLLPELARNQQIRDRFINEARTLSLLSHQNIVTLYDFSDVDGNLVLVMEYTEGTPLDTVIEKITGAIPEQRCTNIFRQVLDGFSYAHRKGVVHRDIKPANIILQSDDTPKILDFGIAKIVEGDVKLTKTGTRMGSVVYMSPEQVMGRDVDQRSDIYSLGVTLFEMLSGRLPYDTQTESEFDIQTKIVREPLPPIRSINPNVSETLESAIIKATEKDVNYRFQSCEEFSNALGQSEFSYTPQKTVYQQPQQNRTVFNEPAHLNARLSYPQKRSKTPIILFGGGAAAVIVILLIFFLTQNNDNSVEKVTTSTIENNTKPQENKQPVKEPSTTTESQPVETVRSFISELGNRDFYSAYNRQNNKSWGDYSFFSSTKSFGGIRSTTIESISLNYENHGEASVYIDYTANDPSNKNGRYKQDFFLKKIGGEWKIVKVKNISIEQW